MKILFMLVIFFYGCANCEREDCVNYCEKIQFSDALKAIHKSVIRKEDPNPRACYEIVESIDQELIGSYCLEKDNE